MKVIPPEIQGDVVNIILYCLGLVTNWVARLLMKQKNPNKYE